MKTGKIQWKRVGLLLGGAVMLCGLVGLAYYTLQGPLRSALRSQFWETDPVRAAETARALIDFDLPPGYQPEKVLKSGPGVVVIASRDHPSDLILIGQAPNGILSEEEWLTSYAKRGAQEIAGELYDTEITSTQAATIRGQPATLLLLEGTNMDGQAVRQVACMFNGKSGEILLVMVASQDTWDQDMVDHFLNSIQ